MSKVTICDSHNWILYIWFVVNQMWSEPLPKKSNFIHPLILHVKIYQNGHHQSSVAPFSVLWKL